MKTLALYVLLLGVGVVSLRSDTKVERELFYATLTSIELPTEDLFKNQDYRLKPVQVPELIKTKNTYHIYYENSSQEPIEVAIRYKALSGEWQTRGIKTIAPGEQQLMGLSSTQTYYSYAQHTGSGKRWNGNYSFTLKNSSEAIDFKKNEIQDCKVNQECKVFAVFR